MKFEGDEKARCETAEKKRREGDFGVRVVRGGWYMGNRTG